jgi:hypothetical protein
MARWELLVREQEVSTMRSGGLHSYGHEGRKFDDDDDDDDDKVMLHCAKLDTLTVATCDLLRRRLPDMEYNCGQADWGLGGGLTNLHIKKKEHYITKRYI